MGPGTPGRCFGRKFTRVTAAWSDVALGRAPFDWWIWRAINLIAWADRFDVEFAPRAAP